MKINPTTKANYYVPLNFGPQNHEKSKFCPPNLRVTTKKNEGCGFPRVYVTSWKKLLPQKRRRLKAWLAADLAENLAAQEEEDFHCEPVTAPPRVNLEMERRGFFRRRPTPPCGWMWVAMEFRISGSAWEGFEMLNLGKRGLRESYFNKNLISFWQWFFFWKICWHLC